MEVVTAQRLDGVRFEFRVASPARLTSDRSAMTSSSRSLVFWLGPSAVLVAYATVNLACVFLPFIPGVAVYLGFGLIAPVVLAMLHYMWVRKQREEFKYWKPWALLGAALYVALGIFSFRVITLLWASI